MGYGGAREEAGRAIGKSGDGGIDGVIDQDPLGLDRYICRPSDTGRTFLSASPKYVASAEV
jgi:restriction endonuclease Mrr